MGTVKTQVQQSTSNKSTPDTTPDIAPLVPEKQQAQAQSAHIRKIAQQSANAANGDAGTQAPVIQGSTTARARIAKSLQRQYGHARMAQMMSAQPAPQTKIAIGKPNDQYEQEADKVAEQVTSGQTVARISRIGGGSAAPIRREMDDEDSPAQMTALQQQPEEEESLQATSIRREPEEEEAVQAQPLQRQEEEEPIQASSLQRMNEEEEPVQATSIQREPEEEESVQALPIQRQEEEEPLQASPIQRMNEEEEPVQVTSIQREPEEEEAVQAQPVQRQEEEEPVQASPIQRMNEEEEPVQATSIRREPEEEEAVQALPVQRQEEEEPIQVSPIQRMNEEEEPVQATSIQREPEEEEAVQAQSLQRQEEEEPIQASPIQRMNEEEEPVQAASIQREPEEEESIQAQPIQRQEREEEPAPQLTKIQREEAGAEEQTEEAWPEPTEDEMQATEAVQAKSDESGNSSVQDAGLAARIDSPGSGRSLTDSTRTTMEKGMGTDFSGVRIHDGSQAQDDAKQLGAKAFAYKNNVWLGKGASDSDNKLMAHELTHVVQQGAAVQKISEETETKTEEEQATPSSIQTARIQATPAQTTPATPQVSRAEEKKEEKGKKSGWFMSKVAGFAKNIPGYHLLSVIIGKDPISGDPVARSATNVIKGVISLIPGGNLLYENLNKTGAIDKAGAWLSKQIDNLGFSWAYIKGLFGEAWDALRWYDLLLPWKAFGKIKKVFTQPIKRLWNFAKSIGSKIMEFVFEGAMALAGAAGKKVLGVIRKAGGAFMKIIKDPIGFIGNLVKSLAKGFGQFSANIWKHLKAGLLGWLFGALAGSGLQMPDTLNLKGILSIALQVLGITYQAIRKRIAKVIGEKRMAKVEKTVSFVTDLVTNGPMAAWEMITNAIGSLKDMVLGAIQNWVVTKIVKSAVIKLVSMFNPAGAIIQAVMAIYNTVMFFVERFQQIAELVGSVFKSIGKIAAGAVGAAANFIELTMAKTLPVLISFLARLLGLGGIGEKIKGVIKKIQKPIGKGIGKVVNFVVGKVKKMFGKGGKKGKNSSKDINHDDQVNAGLRELHTKEKNIAKGNSGKLSITDAKKVAKFIKSRHKIFKDIKVEDGKSNWIYHYYASEGNEKSQVAKSKDVVPIPTSKEQKKIDSFVSNLNILRDAHESGDLTKLTDSRKTLEEITDLSIENHKKEGDYKYLLDHIATLENSRVKLEKNYSAGGNNWVMPVEEPLNSGNFVEGIGRKFSTDSVKLGLFRGKSFAEVEGAIGRPPDQIGGNAPGAIRMTWKLKDKSFIHVDVPGTDNKNQFMINRIPHLAKTASKPYEDLHLDDMGIGVPANSTPAHIVITPDRLLQQYINETKK